MNAFSLHYLVINTTAERRQVIRMHWVLAWLNNTSAPQINNRGGRWHGSAVPGAAELEPEGDRSSIVLLCNSRRNHLSATLLHSPALITNWSVIHHPQRCWGLAVVGVCAPRAHKRERERRERGCVCRLWIPVLSHHFLFNFIFRKSTQNVRGGRKKKKKKPGERVKQTRRQREI